MAHPCSRRPLSKSFVLLFLAALAVTVSGVGADINLVLNPGFESPSDGRARWVVWSYSPLDSWNYLEFSEEIMSGGYWTPHSGTQSLSLNGYDGPGWISQNLATVAGGTYDLSFFMSGAFLFQGANDTTRSLVVYWDSDTVPLGTVTFTKPSGWSQSNMGWTLKSGGILSGLTASGPSTELKFVSLEPGTYEQSPALDDISVTSVPEPGSLSLLLLALPGVVWLRRRRRA